MPPLQLTQPPVAQTGMLIRKPPAEVFEAFIDPAITTHFWFTGSSGPLIAGETVEWEWKMYQFSIPVEVLAVAPNERILIRWPGEPEATNVEWTFEPVGAQATFVTIANSGFAGDGNSILKQATDATEGFSLVLAGLKAWLEHGIELNLVGDRFPQGLENS